MPDSPTSYQMLWDCAQCGTQQLLGLTHRHCPQCGTPQDPARRYFPPAGQEIAVEDHVYHGADRSCPYCATPNSAKANNCGNCGGPLDGSAEVSRVETPHTPPSATPPPPPGWITPKRAVLGCLLLPVLAIAAFVLFAVISNLWTKNETVQITGISWERVIDVESFAPRAQKAWCDAMPSDAYQVSRSREQRGSNQIPDGEECRSVQVDQGDGTFRVDNECTPRYREEPIYDDFCSFLVNRWEKARDVRGGAHNREPKWPEVRLRQTGDCLGCEREGPRQDNRYVHYSLAERNTPDSCSVAEPVWLRMEAGQKAAVQVRVIGGGVVCSSLGKE